MAAIFKGKGDIRDCGYYKAEKILEYRMKVMERVLERKHCRIVTVDKMQFGFIPKRGTIDGELILRRHKKSIMLKEKSYICVL